MAKFIPFQVSSIVVDSKVFLGGVFKALVYARHKEASVNTMNSSGLFACLDTSKAN